MRRLVAAGIIVVILAAIWVGGWFWLARMVEANAEPALDEIAERGVSVECPNRTIGGFPFALRVTCGETAVAERSTGTRADFAGATGGASIFRPLTAEIALNSPGRVESPLLEGPLEVRWSEAAVDVGLGLDGPKNYSFDATQILGTLTLPGLPEQTLAATTAEAHLAPSEDGGSAIALAFADLSYVEGDTRYPLLTGSAIGEISVPPRALARGRDGIELPVEARGVRIMLESGGARFVLEGDIAMSENHTLDGTIIVSIAGIDAFHDFIAALPEEMQRIGNAVVAGMLISGQPTEIDGKQGSEVRIPIDGSRAKIGLIEFDLSDLGL
jgi:hypothetical protein